MVAMNLTAVRTAASAQVAPGGRESGGPPAIARLRDPGLPANVLVLNNLALNNVELAARLQAEGLKLAERLRHVDDAPACLLLVRTLRELVGVQSVLTQRVEGLMKTAAGLSALRRMSDGVPQ